MKKVIASVALALMTMIQAGAQTTISDTELAQRNINRCMAIVDACWDKTMAGSEAYMYMADTYNTADGSKSGPSDIWPLTAAVEAHCSLLEAIDFARRDDESLYEAEREKYAHRLEVIIDNLDYYRGSYRRPSYATRIRSWQPYAVPRASQKGKADVTGIFNVYDDQMWLSRELIRAWRLTGKQAYLDRAAYLADYVLDGWDCWRDADGNEYGGITWGPGYNSKHACSNAPVIQPLVWLAEIYADSDEKTEYNYRDADNKPVTEQRLREEIYLDFAQRIFDWQYRTLAHPTGVYYDMIGGEQAEVVYKDGYRQHINTGRPGGEFYPYNTGTMIAGAAELLRVTGDETYAERLNASVSASLGRFCRYSPVISGYVLTTDEKATSGFRTWFNDVLLRGLADAEPYCSGSACGRIISAAQAALDYAYDNYNRGGFLPIDLTGGWGDETVTKPFHQFAFASEYGVLALRLLKRVAEEASVNADVVSSGNRNTSVYTLSGIEVGAEEEVAGSLPSGVYIIGGSKTFVKE